MTAPTTFAEWLPEFDLKTLFRTDRPVLVAGGALRDSWFGKEVTDVDLFIGVREYMLKDCWHNKQFSITVSGNIYAHHLIRFLGRPTSLNFDVDFDGAYEAGDFVSGRSPDKPGLNVILFKHEGDDESFAEKLFEKFPCSISRIAWSPVTDKWYIHPSFRDSACTKMIGLHPTVTFGTKYYKKIYPKYKGWSYFHEY